MKTNRFLATFRANTPEPTNYGGEYFAKVYGSFGAFLATQQHNLAARKAFLADMTGHRDPEPKSLSIELQGHFIPIY